MDLNVEKVRALKRQAAALESIATNLAALTRETRASNARLRAILYKLEENVQDDGEGSGTGSEPGS